MSDDIRHILDGLRAPAPNSSDNVVAQARRMVEAHVPEGRRGPGWDRHWRELEAYLQEPGQWSAREERPSPEGQTAKPDKSNPDGQESGDDV